MRLICRSCYLSGVDTHCLTLRLKRFLKKIRPRRWGIGGNTAVPSLPIQCKLLPIGDAFYWHDRCHKNSGTNHQGETTKSSRNCIEYAENGKRDTGQSKGHHTVFQLSGLETYFEGLPEPRNRSVPQPRKTDRKALRIKIGSWKTLPACSRH